MMSWIANLEQTALSVWIRETPSLLGFPTILFLHTLGLAMLAGLSVGIDIWLLVGRGGVVRASVDGLHRVMWAGFGINAASGILLLIAYPAKALTNWLFYAKLILVGLAVWLAERIRAEIAATNDGASIGIGARRLAWWSLAIWAGTILAGRLLAYTHSILLASEGF